MRSMRKKLHWGGLAAVVGATALVMPLLAMDSAQAAFPKSNLSITKTVASLAPPVTFLPGLRDVRTSGHEEWTPDGLHIWTTDNSGQAKVAEYFERTGPLPTSASIEWTGTNPAPGMQIVFDADGIDGNGNDYNILVGEPTYYGANWWLTGSSSADAKAADPSGANNGGNGSEWFGTLAQWSAALPNARMLAGGFSLGSGILGDGVIAALTYGSTRYDFGRSYQSSIQAQPGDTVEYKLTVRNGTGANPVAAENVKVTDVLPAELSYVSGSLVDNGNGCSFKPAGKVLTCNAGTFGVNGASTIRFRATIDDQISTVGLPKTQGHWVDVQKQEVFADLPAGKTKTYAAYCPSGFIPTDGGLLLDAVDQGGYYSDVVISSSEQTASGGNSGWTVTATNLGDQRAQGKVKVTCLNGTVGSSGGHTHSLIVTDAGAIQGVSPASPAASNVAVTRACPTGYTPIAPVHAVPTGVAVIRESYAVGNVWKWVVDHEDDTNAWFNVHCLAPKTAPSNGHQASLQLSTKIGTVTVGPEQRTEGVLQCADGGNGIVGGYSGDSASVLSLGKEPRGNNYMFRFYNEDWDSAYDADYQVTCVGVRTADEPTYYHVVNTATVSTTTNDANSADNSSSADVAVNGDPAAPAPSGVTVDTTGTRSVVSGKTKSVTLGIKCPTSCSFTVKVVKGGDVVAKATKAVTSNNVFKPVVVNTTSAGKFLGSGLVSVKIKTTSGTSTFPVNLS